MKVVNISADKIAMFGLKEPVFLERNGVDVEIGRVLIELDRQSSFGEVLVINGPGGFTNLRVGTLALNLLNVLKEGQISFFVLSKLELYRIAFKKGFLPRWGVIYIGQKMNLRIWDFDENMLVKVVKKSDLGTVIASFETVFFDEVYEKAYFEGNDQVSNVFDAGGWSLAWQGNQFLVAWDELLIHPVQTLEPNYMIDPNIH